MKWGFGDARCTVQIDISRARIVAAVTARRPNSAVPAHTANCIVEQDGQLKTVTATLAPKIVFKDGKAEKIWINLLNVEGPAAIKATLSTAAQLNDTIGLFHRTMLKSVNGYIYKHCPKYFPLTQSRHGDPYEAGAGQAGKSAPSRLHPRTGGWLRRLAPVELARHGACSGAAAQLRLTIAVGPFAATSRRDIVGPSEAAEHKALSGGLSFASQ